MKKQTRDVTLFFQDPGDQADGEAGSGCRLRLRGLPPGLPRPAIGSDSPGCAEDELGAPARPVRSAACHPERHAP